MLSPLTRALVGIGLGGSSPDANIVAPSLAWMVTIGSSPTITPGTWVNNPPLTYDLYRDGVVTSTVDRTLAQANAYVAIDRDIGANALTWREKDAGAGLYATTNAVAYTPETGLTGVMFRHEPRNAGNTLVSGAAQRLLDLSGNANHADAPSSGARPPVAAEALLNGIATANFGTAHSLIVAACARPAFQFIVGRPKAGGTAGYLITAYNVSGAGYVPCIRNADGYALGYQVQGTNKSTIGTDFADSYFRPFALIDGGTGASACHLDQYDSTAASIAATGATTDATARVTGTHDFRYNPSAFPTVFDMACSIACSSVPSAGQIADLVAWARYQFIEAPTQSVMEWVGTLTTNATAQPRPYPTKHNGVSGETLQAYDWMMSGVWTGTDTTIGSAGDPGAGNRGAIETICTTQAKTNVVALWLGPPAVETQSGVAAQYNACLRAARRMFAVAGVGPGSLAHLYIGPILPGLLAPYSDTEGALFNAWAQATMIPTLQGEGLSVSWMDLLTGFDKNTMLLAADQHLNQLGDQFCATAIYNKLVADGYASASYRLLLSGHSHVAGGNLNPYSTAQFRPYLARDLAV